jgi:SAM-dependent methyltransferase
VDVGVGKAWQLPSYYKYWYGIELIGLDIDGSEMKNNDTLDQKIVCDVVAGIPLADGQIDLIMVHSGRRARAQHSSDNEHFLRNAFRILRPGGFLLAEFPGRFAPFAMANRRLPDRLAKHLLRVAMGIRKSWDSAHITTELTIQLSNICAAAWVLTRYTICQVTQSTSDPTTAVTNCWVTRLQTPAQ